MFEKEAEEYADNREVCGLLDAISENLQNYDYGTVAHYNIDPLVEECFKDGAEFGYNKANEWHKPSEKLPKECTLVLAYSFDDTEPSLYEYVASDTWEWMPRRIASLSNDQIRLWKEIVLPELKESE